MRRYIHRVREKLEVGGHPGGPIDLRGRRHSACLSIIPAYQRNSILQVHWMGVQMHSADIARAVICAFTNLCVPKAGSVRTRLPRSLGITVPARDAPIESVVEQVQARREPEALCH